MRQWENAECCLHQKLHILQKIAANTETQNRFIQKREMKGLKRVLRERDALIAALAAVNAELASDSTWKDRPEVTALLQEIADLQQQIMARSRQVLQHAIAEKSRIAVELKNSKLRRQVHDGYINPWVTVAQGRFINEKG